MKPLAPYLFFDGNCKEAMNFYKKIFGGQLEVMTYADGPKNSHPDAIKERVMHAYLKSDDLVLMASDMPTNKEKSKVGNNVQISTDCSSLDEIETKFKQMSEGGKVFMPLTDTFWGARFGMLTDKYGFHWMFNFDKAKK